MKKSKIRQIIREHIKLLTEQNSGQFIEPFNGLVPYNFSNYSGPNVPIGASSPVDSEGNSYIDSNGDNWSTRLSYGGGPAANCGNPLKTDIGIVVSGGVYFGAEAFWTVIEYAFNVGFEEDADGFVVDKFSGRGPQEIGADWEDLWGYGFKDEIMNLPEEYRDLGSREDYPVYEYTIGSYDYEMANISISVKKEDPQVESLARDIHKKYEEKYGEGKESSYRPRFPMAYSHEEDKLVTPEEAIPKDDWKESLSGKE